MVRRNFGGLSAARARGGFTLVELLVVIIIIAILAAIAVPAVMRATATAQNARIKTEIDMLHMAIQQYKNEYGSYPPAVDVDTAGNRGRVNKHLQRLFPRITADFLLNSAAAGNVLPNNALVGWLTGYTDEPTNPMGIKANSGGGESLGLPKKKLFDFDTSRVSDVLPAGKQFAPPSKPGSPYIYIDSASYLVTGLPATVEIDPKTTKPFNPDSFQIISAGRDEKYGNDDDLSNFWPSTRKDYLDSLK